MKTKRCHACEKGKLKPMVETVRLSVGPFAFAGHVAAERCAACKTLTYAGGDYETFELRVADQIARRGLASSETFRFLRKAGLDMSAKDFAKLLDVTPETVSRWENGKLALPVAAWSTLATLVVERLEDRTTAMDALKARATKHAKKVIQIDAA